MQALQAWERAYKRVRAWPRVKCSGLKSGRATALPALSLAPALESSGTSGRQLKLIDYRLLVLSQPEKSHRMPL